MDLGYSTLQEMLRKTARTFVEREELVRRHRNLISRGQPLDDELWRKMGDLGWYGLLVPEAHGGTGGCWLDAVVLLEALGRGLAPYQLLAQMLAGRVIDAYGTEGQRQTLLPDLSRGVRRFAVALTEPRATVDATGIQCEARAVEQDFVLEGVKHFVRGASTADELVLLARVADGFGLFLVDRQSGGIEAVALPNIGDDAQQRLALHAVRVPRERWLGQRSWGWEAVERVVDWGALLECGYAAGLMAKDLEMTADYVKQRVQFGRPLGVLQAVQHQVADQVTDVETSWLLTCYAAWEMDELRPTAHVAVARAKAWASDALRRVVRTGNQLHGGIGFATEYDLYLFYQRAKTAELMFGTADEHRERVAAALLDG